MPLDEVLFGGIATGRLVQHWVLGIDPGTAVLRATAAPVEGLDGPLPDDVPDIRYTPEDDAILEGWLRENVTTTWHSLGTCKMAPLETGGVVDANLSVYGVRGLKVADLSMAPENVGANTANTAMTIGEKAAEIFIKELGLGTTA